MKISKIIFISLLSTIALIILSSALYVRFTGLHKDDLSGMSILNQKLSEIKVLCVSNCNNITISSSDTLSIKATWPKDSVLSKDFYKIKGDTLILSNINKIVDVKINANEKLSNLILKESSLTISSAPSSKLVLTMMKSYVYINAGENKQSILKTMIVDAKNHSRINSDLIKIDTLRMKMQKSESSLSLHSKNVFLNLSDSSRVYGSQFESLIVKKDSTCIFYSYN